MNGTQRRQYEMLLRVRDFGNTYRASLSSPAAASLLEAVATTIDHLAAADMQKRSASGASRAERKQAARKALIDLIQRAGQLSKVLRSEGHNLPPCDLPASMSVQALLTAGRQLALDADAFAELASHGIVPAHVTDVTGALEAAVNDRGLGRAGHIAARARIQELIAGGLRHARKLDVVVASELANNAVARTVWKQERRLQQPRGPHVTDEAETPATAVAPEATATPPAPEKEVAA